jgi:hypothetical protein
MNRSYFSIPNALLFTGARQDKPPRSAVVSPGVVVAVVELRNGQFQVLPPVKGRVLAHLTHQKYR